MRSLVSSIFLYACESWTLTAEFQRRIQAMKMRCYRKILRISYKDHVTNEEVRAKIQQAIGPHEDLLAIVKRRKLLWYGHVSRSSGLAKITLQGTVKKGRRQGRQRNRCYNLSFHLSLNREGRWGTTDDFTTSFLHFSLFFTVLWDLANSSPVHSQLLSFNPILCLPCLLPPFTVPCKMILARLDERET